MDLNIVLAAVAVVVAFFIAIGWFVSPAGKRIRKRRRRRRRGMHNNKIDLIPRASE